MYLTDADLQIRQLLAADTSYAFTQTAASTGGTYVTSRRFARQFTPGTPLPVALVSFTAERVAGAARLRWLTASELRNDHFDVENSLDGRPFRRVG